MRPQPLRAGTFEFEGTVFRVGSSSVVSVGDNVTGTVEYADTGVDFHPDDPAVGRYFGALISADVSIGGIDVSISNVQNGQVFVGNDVLTSSNTLADIFVAECRPCTAQVTRFFSRLWDDSTTAFDDDSIPSQLLPSDFPPYPPPFGDYKQGGLLWLDDGSSLQWGHDLVCTSGCTCETGPACPPLAIVQFSESDEFQSSSLFADDTFLIGKRVVIDTTQTIDPDGIVTETSLAVDGPWVADNPSWPGPTELTPGVYEWFVPRMDYQVDFRAQDDRGNTSNLLLPIEVNLPLGLFSSPNIPNSSPLALPSGGQWFSGPLPDLVNIWYLVPDGVGTPYAAEYHSWGPEPAWSLLFPGFDLTLRYFVTPASGHEILSANQFVTLPPDAIVIGTAQYAGAPPTVISADGFGLLIANFVDRHDGQVAPGLLRAWLQSDGSALATTIVTTSPASIAFQFQFGGVGDIVVEVSGLEVGRISGVSGTTGTFHARVNEGLGAALSFATNELTIRWEGSAGGARIDNVLLPDTGLEGFESDSFGPLVPTGLVSIVSASVFACTDAGVRAAIAAGGGPNAFNCTVPTVITASAAFQIRDSVQLDGGGLVTLSSSGNDGVLFVAGQFIVLPPQIVVELANLRIVGGFAEPGQGAGGITIANNADLTLRNVEVSGNSSVSGAINIRESSLTIVNGALINNTGELVGAIASFSSVVSLVNTTVSGNRAVYSPGIESGPLSPQHSAAIVSLQHVTFEDNVSTLDGLGAIASVEPVHVANSVIAGSCFGGTISNGGNIESPGNTCGLADPTDQSNVTRASLALGPLQNNGSPTQTHALLPGSVAIDAGVFVVCPATDQRGVERPQGAACDIGAVEYVPEPAAFALQLTALICTGLMALSRRGLLQANAHYGCRG